ncbi:MAG: ABC transporter, permease protein 1 (cluster 5, nickel/peptides/opines), partial [uncultured Solirubrobacteraceae bacterium]
RPPAAAGGRVPAGLPRRAGRRAGALLAARPAARVGAHRRHAGGAGGAHGPAHRRRAADRGHGPVRQRGGAPRAARADARPDARARSGADAEDVTRPGDGGGLRPHGAGQGPGRAHDPPPSRPAQRGQPDADHGRPPVRTAARRDGRGRAHLRLAGPRALPGPVDRLFGLPGDHRRDAAAGGRLRRGQLPRRRESGSRRPPHQERV